MATIIDSLLITMGLDGSGVSKGMSQVENRLERGVKNITTNILAPLAGAFAFGALVKNFTGTADSLGILAKHLRSNIQDVQAWGSAVESVGGDAASLHRTMAGLEETLRAAQFGPGSAELRQLGVRTRDANGNLKTSVDILNELAVAAGRVNPEKFERLTDSLGIDAVTIQLLQSGSQKVEALVNKYKDLAYTQKDAGTAREFNRVTGDLNKTLQAGAAIFMRLLIPVLTEAARVTTTFVNFLRRHESFVLLFFTMLASVIALKLTPAIIAMGKAWLANPLVRIAALVLLLAGALEDLWYFVNGGSSAIEKLMRKMGFSAETIEKVRAAAGVFLSVLKQYGPALITLVGAYKVYTGGVLAANTATLALGKGFGAAATGARLFSGALLLNPLFLFIAGLVLLVTHLEEVSAAIQVGRDKMNEWGRAAREAVGLDPDGPTGADLVEVEYGGRKTQMSRNAAMRSIPGLTHDQVMALPRVGQPGKPSAADAITPSAADAVSPALAARGVTYHSEDKYDVLVEVKSTDPVAAGQEAAKELRRITAAGNKGVRQ